MDIRTIKAAASADWEDLLIQYGGIDADILDGRHHPCPKCGGKDRFRYFRDGTGGAICNQCFSSKNADGIATLAWLRDEPISQVMKLIAEHYGLQHIKKNGRKGKEKKKADKYSVSFHEWSDALAEVFCLRHKPVTVDALKAFGARMGTHQDVTVIAIPIYGKLLAPSDIVGWVLFNASGGKMPVGKTGELVAKKTAPGSKSGYVGPIATLREKSTKHVWKCEGITDALTLHLLLPAGHVAITNAAGCKERPQPWMCEALRDRIVYVVHDCDVPGQEGAMYVRQSDGSERPGWAPCLAVHAEQVRNVVLPFPIQPDHGKDLRDWLMGGAGFVELTELASNTEPVRPPADGEKALERAVSSRIFTAEDDPHVLAQAVISSIENQGHKLVRWNGEWWRWSGKTYARCDSEVVKSTISRVVHSQFEQAWLKRAENSDTDEEVRPRRKVTTSIVSNVESAMISFSILESNVPMGSWVNLETGESRHRNILSMENGLLDVDCMLQTLKRTKCSPSPDDLEPCLMPHSPNWFSPVSLPYKFDPDAECDTWKRVVRQNLNNDLEQMRCFQQWCGYCLIFDTSLQKFLILEGDGGNGKSVLLAGLEAILGSQNVSAVSLEGFGARFEKSLTLGKLANITHDAGEIDRHCIDQLKSFTSGDPVIFDRKNRDPIVATPTARLTIACNNLPNWGDKSDGIWRRILLLQCKQKISQENRIPNMDTSRWWLESGELPGMLCWAIVGLYDLMELNGGKFSGGKSMEAAIESYRAEINTARAFLQDEVVEDSSCEIECTDLYGRYVAWCRERGNHPQAIQSFGREVGRLFPDSSKERVRREGERKYVYKAIGLRGDFLD